MTYFIVELLTLSLLIWVFLDREFKRLKRQYEFKNWMSITIRAKLEAFEDAMMVVGQAAQKAAVSIRKFSEAFNKE